MNEFDFRLRCPNCESINISWISSRLVYGVKCNNCGELFDPSRLKLAEENKERRYKIMDKWVKTNKHMSLKTIWEEIDDKGCEEANKYYTEFHEKAILQGYKWDWNIAYDEIGDSILFDFLKEHPEIYPWMEEKGFLEKVKPEFKPFTITVETEDEAKIMYHRLNIAWNKVRASMDTSYVDAIENESGNRLFWGVRKNLIAQGIHI